MNKIYNIIGKAVKEEPRVYRGNYVVTRFGTPVIKNGQPISKLVKEVIEKDFEGLGKELGKGEI